VIFFVGIDVEMGENGDGTCYIWCGLVMKRRVALIGDCLGERSVNDARWEK
jgi:hypothetical protein